MEYLANITPLGLAAIALSGVLAWIQWLAKKDMVKVQSQFETEQSERQKITAQLQNERAQLSANHELYGKLIDTINGTSKSADKRDEDHNLALRDLANAINNLGVETRNSTIKQLEASQVVKDAINLQSDGIKAIITSNGAILDKLVSQDTVINGHAKHINEGIGELNNGMKAGFTQIEGVLATMQDALNAMQKDQKSSRALLETAMKQLSSINDNNLTKGTSTAP